MACIEPWLVIAMGIEVCVQNMAKNYERKNKTIESSHVHVVAMGMSVCVRTREREGADSNSAVSSILVSNSSPSSIVAGVRLLIDSRKFTRAVRIRVRMFLRTPTSYI